MSFTKFCELEFKFLLVCICLVFIKETGVWLFESCSSLSTYPYMKISFGSLACFFGVNIGAAMWGLASATYKFFRAEN